MKKLLITFLLSTCFAFGQADYTLLLRFNDEVVAGGGGGGFSDDFNRGNNVSLGANWTEITDVEILGNEVSAAPTFDFTHRGAAYTGASATANQYIKVTLTAATSQRPGVVLRYTDGSSPCYTIEFDVDGDLARLEHYSTPTGTRTELNTAALTVTLPGTFGVTITGTGTATVWRIWASPTANAPDSASSWDGAGPTVTFTDDPASPVNTGNHVGIGGIGSGAAMAWDNFFGGPL